MCSRVVLIRLEMQWRLDHISLERLIKFSNWCLSIVEQSPAFTGEKGEKSVIRFLCKDIITAFHAASITFATSSVTSLFQAFFFFLRHRLSFPKSLGLPKFTKHTLIIFKIDTQPKLVWLSG